jgi:hypothetical protein
VFVNRFKARWIVDALEAERYTTWFQPIVHAGAPDSAPPFACEGLFRLRDRDGTQIPPEPCVRGGIRCRASIQPGSDRSAVVARVRVKSKLFINFNPSSIYDPSYCLRTTAAAIEDSASREVFRPPAVARASASR